MKTGLLQTVLLSASLLGVGTGMMRAQTGTSSLWLGGGANSLWSNNANWQNQLSPGAGSSTTFADFSLNALGTNVDLDVNTSLSALFIHPPASKTFTFTTANGSVLTLYAGGLMVGPPETSATPLLQASFAPTLSIQLAAPQQWHIGGPASIAGTIGGAGHLTLAGMSTLSLTGANTYTGGTSLLSGSVILGRSSTGTPGAPTSGPLGTGIIDVPSTAATPALLADAPGITLHNAIIFPVTTFQTPSPEVYAYANTPITSSFSSGVPTLGLGTTATANSLTLAGPITGHGRLELLGGNVTLSGSNNFRGLVTVGPQANLIVTTNKGLGGSNVLLIEPGGNFRFDGTALNLFAFGDGSLQAEMPPVSNSSRIDLASNATLSTTFAGSFTGTITGAGAKLVGSGYLLHLAGNNTYSGGTTLRSGTLAFGSSSVVTAGTLVSSPVGTGLLRISASPAAMDPYSESGYYLTPRLVATATDLTLANPIEIASPLLRLGGDSFYNSTSTWSNNFTLSGPISGTGGIQVSGGGTYTLSGVNTFAGGIEVNQGTLVIASATGAGTGDLTLNQMSIARIEHAAPVLRGLYGYAYETAPELQLQTNSVLRLQKGHFSGRIVGTGAKLIKEGSESLTLEGSSTYSGGTEVAGGTLYLTGYSTAAQGVISSGPAGTGTIKVLSGAGLAASPMFEARLHNPIQLASGSRLGESGLYSNGLTLYGNVTLLDKTSIINLGGKPFTVLDTGSVLDASQSGTTVTFTGDGRLTLRGSTSSYISSIVADGSSLLFETYPSLQFASVNAISNGYIGIGQAFDGQGPNRSFADLLAKITQPALFAGTLGLDSAPAAGVPADFIGTFDLSGFTNADFRGLGTTSHATIGSSATILLPAGGSYRFGGGGGRLGVNATLSGASAGVIVDSTQLAPLTLVLRGNNTFGGNVSVTNSFLVLDSPSALPSGRTIRLGSGGYASYTPYWSAGTTSAADFIARLSTDYDASGIIGFDSAAPATSPLTLSAPIDLSALPRSVFLGTTTNTATLSGTIKPPPGGTLQLAAFQGGHLRIDSALTSANGVLAVQIGHPTAALGSEKNTVTLAGANTYTNGTVLANGTLGIASSSVLGGGGAIVSGPLGIGQLTLSGNGTLRHMTPGTDLFIGNGIVLGGTGTALNLEGNNANFLKLGGIVSGQGGLNVHTKALLSGNNTFSGGTRIFDSLTIDHGKALGTGSVELADNYASLTVGANATAPVVNNLSGVFGSNIYLPSGITLTLNNTAPTEFEGSINGTGASLNKTGTGEIRLSGYSNYDGGTTITAGKVVAASGNALGTGTVTLAGGSLDFEKGTYINNPVSVGAGSRLQGNATIYGNVALSQGAVVAPGNSVGTLSFGSNLSWTGGAFFDFEVQRPAGMPGFGYDTIDVTSTLSLTATASNPFVINLISLNESGAVGPMAFDPTVPYSWQIATASSFSGLDLNALSLNTSGFSTLTPFSGSFSFDVGSGGNGSTLLLNFTPVPEPRTWVLMLLGAGLLVRPVLRRRRR